jgi:hypothetical protein
MHLLGACPAQGAGALVDGGAGRVDVVHECQAAGAGAGRECATDVASAREGIEPSLRTHVTRAMDELCDGQVPPVAQLGGDLGGGIGAARESAVAHGGHDGDRLDRRPRQLVGDQRRGKATG